MASKYFRNKILGMGSYNILHVKVPCSKCHSDYDGEIQLKYGNTWQLHYRIGEILTWGGNDMGIPGLNEVKAYGILQEDNCSVCKEENKNNEYDILIQKDINSRVQLMVDATDYFENETFKIIFK